MTVPGPGHLALLGSGGDDPRLDEVHSWLLGDRPRVVVHVTTATAVEGARALDACHRDGEALAARLGAERRVVDIRVRADAETSLPAGTLESAGLVLISDGSARHLVRTLQGTRAWSSILRAWACGASLAAAGASASALGGYLPDVRNPRSGGADGLGIVPELRVLPDFSSRSAAVPDTFLRPLLGAGAVVVGIDAGTALVGAGPQSPETPGRPWAFRGRGHGSAWRIDTDRRRRVNAPLHLAVALP